MSTPVTETFTTISTNAAVVRPREGKIFKSTVTNPNPYPIYVKLYDKAVGDVDISVDLPSRVITVWPSHQDQNTGLDWTFWNAITARCVKGAADSDNTPVGTLPTITLDISASGFITAVNVKDYGAVGDGVTDDYGAILAAYNAIPSTGGVLYFPSSASFYKTSAGFNIAKPITIRGDGSGGPQDIITVPRSTISFSTATGTLFTQTAHGVTYEDIALINPNGAVTGGAGISVTTNGEFTRYNRVTVSGFYIDIDHQTGVSAAWNGCYLVNPVLYGLKLQNTNNVDGGDAAIIGSWFHSGAKTGPSSSAIRIESGGGYKITTCKINVLPGGNPWRNGIDMHLADGASSQDFLLSNTSVEGWGLSGASYGISFSTTNSNSGYSNIVIDGNQILGNGAGASALNITSTSAGQFSVVSITGNTVYSSPASFVSAYNFINVRGIRFDISNITDNYSLGTTFSNCTETTSTLQNGQTSDGAITYGLRLDNTSTSYNGGPQSGIGFGIKYDSSGDVASVGGISVSKENASDNDYSSYLSLFTRRNGSANAEALRISSQRGVSINTVTDPGTGNLLVAGTIQGNQPYQPPFSLAVADATGDVGALDSKWLIIGSATEGGGLGYSVTDGKFYLQAIKPGVAWKAIHIEANDIFFNVHGTANLVRTKYSLGNGAAAAAGTLANAPVAGNPTKWIPIDDNGTTRYIPAW